MNLSVVLLIAKKEVRDLLRDRRTVMLIIVMPAVLYPIFGLASFAIASSLLGQKTVVGIVGSEYLPATPRLYADGRFTVKPKSDEDFDRELKSKAAPAVVVASPGEPETGLKSKELDVAIVIPAGFADAIATLASPPPTITVLGREGDEKSKLAAKRVLTILRVWQDELLDARIAAKGLPQHFDVVFEVDDPISRKTTDKWAADELRLQFVRVFPFILILWLAAGAVQPAVDITAGERERGTMETLLISPASRTEIVLGKWVAVTIFGFGSVVWNVLWLAGGAVFLHVILGSPVVDYPGLFGCVILGLPLAMLFAAVALTLGVFAKSTKEGQFYQLPLMLGTMPLAFASMIPGQELTSLNSIIPVTGAMLFQQKLLAVTGDPVPWGMAPAIFGMLAIEIALALIIAVRQFSRESVLFREAASGLFGKK